MTEISRREFVEKSFGAVCAYFLFEILGSSQLGKRIVQARLRQMQDDNEVTTRHSYGNIIGL